MSEALERGARNDWNPWHPVGTFFEDGHWVTYFEPVTLHSPHFVEAQRSIQYQPKSVQFKSEQLGRQKGRGTPAT